MNVTCCCPDCTAQGRTLAESQEAHAQKSYMEKVMREHAEAQSPPIRQYTTGATRDTDQGKLMYEGFLSPRVLRRYAQYMHQHRKQSDGTMRGPDNWQKGIPKADYMDSLIRHVFDLWRGWREGGKLDQDLLCAILFNDMGLLFEETRFAEIEGVDISAPELEQAIARVLRESQ